jgi:putative protease
MTKDLKIGHISHYYTNIKVAIVELSHSLSVGDRIMIRGTTTDFSQTVKSIQIEHEKVEKAGPGDSIGLKVNDRVRKGDYVYKIS